MHVAPAKPLCKKSPPRTGSRLRRSALLPGLLACLGAAAATPMHGPARPWAPPGISSPLFESHPAFDPKSGDLYFVRSAKDFTGWRILTSRCESGHWTEPRPPPFAGDGVEADPFFTADGGLYFISTRSTDGIHRKDLDIWHVSRDAAGRWQTPVRLPAPVNSEGQEWFPKLSRDGWLYFGSSRPGGLGKTDIWRARPRGGQWRAENLGPAINTADDEYEPLPSPDGRTLIVQAGSAYYQSWKRGSGWTPRVRMGEDINQNGSEIGALFSPSGLSLLFARDTKDERSGELFLLQTADEAWPPACGSARPEGQTRLQ